MTKEVVEAAHMKDKTHANIAMKLLFDGVQFTEGAVKAAAGTCWPDAMILLLDRRGDNNLITEDVVKAAAGNRRTPVIMHDMSTRLLERRGDYIPITEDVLKAAAGNEIHCYDFVSLLLEQCDKKPNIVTQACS